MQDQTAISQRRACCLVGLSRSVLSYRSKKQRSDARLQGRLRELAAERKRFGYRRLHVLLRREGVNHKKVYRLYREADLAVRRRPRRSARAQGRARIILSPPSGTPRLSCPGSATRHPCRAATARPHARAADAHANAQPLVRAGHPVRGPRGIRPIRPGDPCWVGADHAATAPLLCP